MVMGVLKQNKIVQGASPIGINSAPGIRAEQVFAFDVTKMFANSVGNTTRLR